MPIQYRIDHDARVVVAAGYGTLTDDEVFGYQHEVWSRSDVAGYNELIDMTGVTHIALPSTDRIRELADTAARMDAPGQESRLAIVASADVAYGLGRMFQTYREMNRRSEKEVGVFRTMEEALRFLSIDHPLELPKVG